MEQDHFSLVNSEQNARNAIADGAAYFPNRSTQVIDSGFSNRPCSSFLIEHTQCLLRCFAALVCSGLLTNPERVRHHWLSGRKLLTVCALKP
jgi:hypothetical protein